MIDQIRRAVRTAGVNAATPEGGRAAAVAAAIVKDPLRVLLIRRADVPGDPWSGQMAFPGGRHEPTDADLLSTATRETREELGLDLSGAEYLGAMEDVQAVARGRRLDLRIRPFFFVLPGVPELQPNREVSEVHWGDLEGMRAGRFDTTQPWRDEGREFRFPAYQVGQRRVWGLTYRMLQQLFQALD